MSRIVVLGAGICGLFAGLVLARDGHEVTLLERDPEPVPDAPDRAWEAWSRDGVVQFRQAHYLQPRGRAVLEAELPDVLERLASAGALWFEPLSLMPPQIADRRPRPGDERFRTLTARRPILEQVLGSAADSQPRLDVRRGVAVTELVTRTYNGVPHVAGVRTDRGDTLDGDLVVDATGRRSRLPRWLADVASAPVYEEAEDSGYIYYTRFFRACDGAMPQFRAPPLSPLGSFSILVLPGDNDTWSVTLYASTGDRPLKRLRDRERWEAVVSACPLHAQWLEGEAISEVLPMGGIADRYRRLTVDGEPLVTGVALLADAWACTNPSRGRGMALGMQHASHLRDVARDALDEPRGFAAAWDDVTETHLTPWYRDTLRGDRARLREIEALRNGAAPPAPEGPAALIAALVGASAWDADLLRALLDNACCLATLDEVLARPAIADRVAEVAAEHEPRPLPAPDRTQLLALLA